MKRLFTILAAAVAMFASVNANAQIGLLVGVTSSGTDVKTMEDAKAAFQNVSTYQAGLTFKIPLPLGLAVQPSIIYQVKGAQVSGISDATTADDFELKTGYVEVPVNIQWGPDLIAFRPFVFAEPFVGYQITSDDSTQLGEVVATTTGTTQVEDSFASWSEGAKNRLEYGFGLGVGVEILGHIQITAQYFTNLGNLYNEEQANTTVSELATTIADSAKNITKDVGNFQGIKVNVAILF